MRMALCHYTTFVEILRSKAYLIVPINSERGKRKVTEIIHILQLTTNTFLHQRSEINRSNLAVADRTKRNAYLLSCLANTNFSSWSNDML